MSGCLGNSNEDADAGETDTENREIAGGETDQNGNNVGAVEEPATDAENPAAGETDGDPDQAVSSPDAGDDEPQTLPAQDRPATKTDNIALEGTEEPFEFTLHDVPALQFSTYVVNDFEVAGSSSADGDSFVVYANFAGVKNEEARAEWFSPNDKGATVEQLAADTQKQLESDGYQIVSSEEGAANIFDLSEVEFRFKKQKDDGTQIVGTVGVFSHGDRVYRLTVHYPIEYAEGLMPRVMKMVEDIEWYQ